MSAALQAAPAVAELLEWHPAAQVPDADTTVLLWVRYGAADCDWCAGWWDGDAWRDCSSGGKVSGEVLRWSEPEGPADGQDGGSVGARPGVAGRGGVDVTAQLLDGGDHASADQQHGGRQECDVRLDLVHGAGGDEQRKQGPGEGQGGEDGEQVLHRGLTGGCGRKSTGRPCIVGSNDQLGPAAEARPLVERLNELPALPTPWVCVRDNDDELVSVWRAFQMRDFARACMCPLLAKIAALREKLASFTPLRARGVVDADDNLDCWDTAPFEICQDHVAALNEKDPAAMWRVVDLYAVDLGPNVPMSGRQRP